MSMQQAHPLKINIPPDEGVEEALPETSTNKWLKKKMKYMLIMRMISLEVMSRRIMTSEWSFIEHIWAPTMTSEWSFIEHIWL